jgi:hypothetical protein
MNQTQWVELISKSQYYDHKNESAHFILVYNNIIIPEDILTQFELLKTKKKFYARAEIIDFLHLFVHHYKGYEFIKLYKAVNGEEVKLDIDNKKYNEFYDLWRTALKTSGYLPTTITISSEINVERRKFYILIGGFIDIEYSDRISYRLVKVDKTSHQIKISPNVLEFMRSLVKNVIARYGFIEGSYGGYITKAHLTPQQLQQLYNELINEINSKKNEIEVEINRNLYSEYQMEKVEN